MKTLIIGLGSSGLSAAAFLLSLGKRVIGVDSNPTALGSVSAFPVFPDDQQIDFREVEQVIVSPGVAREHPLYREALSCGIEVIGEAELAFRYLQGRLIAVTGTNGKTTVTLLIEHLFRTFGVTARSLGNIGTPLTSYCILPHSNEVVVVELSSYQLETMATPAFESGIILNITPDHLERYVSMQEYARAKCRLQHCLKPGAPLYVHTDVLHTFGHLIEKNEVVCFDTIDDIEIPFSRHDKQNALAAWAILRNSGMTKSQFLQGLATFKKPAHRIEFVAEIDGVSYYDDSKGTNIDAVLCAVDTMPGKVILIAGGVDKGASYAVWKKGFCGKVKKIIVLGAAADKMMEELSDAFEMKKVDSLDSAVQEAALSAREGEAVLLSPGCASYDMFSNYADRGQKFQRHVNDLQERRIKR